MTNHAREAEVLAVRLRRRNAAGGKRATAQALKAARRLKGSGRASKNAGICVRSPATILKIHKGGLRGDRYSEKSKGAVHLDSNMLSINSKDRAAEWDLDQARHPNVKNLFQHISISRPAGHDLPSSEWKSLLRDFLKELGAEGVNFTSVIHNNTKNQHIHVIFSRALPNGKLLSDSQNFYRWRAALRHAEEKNGLKPIELDPETIATTPKTMSDRHLNATRRANRLKMTPTFIDPARIEHALDASSDIESFVNHLSQKQIEIEISRQKDGTAKGILFRQIGAKEYLAGTSISRGLSLGKVLQRIEENKIMQEELISNQMRQLRRDQKTPTHPRQRG